jgi:hypothetical protein
MARRVNNGLGFAWVKTKSHQGAIRVRNDERHHEFCRLYGSLTWEDQDIPGEGSWVEISPKQLRAAYEEGRPTHRFAYDPGSDHYMGSWDSCFSADFGKDVHAPYLKQYNAGKVADYHECALAVFRDIRRGTWVDPGFNIPIADWKMAAETIEEHCIVFWGLQQAVQLTIPTVYQVNIPTSATHTPQGLGNLKGSWHS